jgi:signal peptidase I
MKKSRGPRATRGPRAFFSVAIVIALVSAWFIYLAPTSIGGSATFVRVYGVSMSPMIEDGDLAIAHAQTSYHSGDLVVFKTDKGAIIHRLVDFNSMYGWRTKGDHNTWIDGWRVQPRQIAGTYWFHVHGLGTALDWTRRNPIIFGLVITFITVLPYLVWHRKRISKTLAAVLAKSEREPWREGRTTEEITLEVVTVCAATLSLGSLLLLIAQEKLLSTQGMFALVAYIVAHASAWMMTLRIFDGWGVEEPKKSLYVLSGMLYKVDALPDVIASTVGSAVALRKCAEKEHVPVLHAIKNGQHQFLVISQKHGNFIWAPPIGLEPITARLTVGSSAN